MIVTCPSCTDAYRLPESLLGPGGARVRCPRCGHTFVVAGGPAPAATEAGTAGPAPEDGPPAIAREVLAELARRSGPRIEEAIARGLLFSEFGEALLQCYQEYVRRAGPAAPAAGFRAALRERWGVDLDPPVTARP